MDKIDIEEKKRIAKENFLNGYNCAQSVVLAFPELYAKGLSDIKEAENFVKNASVGFGGGFARMREVCGCVSGMTMLAGFISPVEDTKNIALRTANYALVQDFALKFKSCYGSIICKELLNGTASTTIQKSLSAASSEDASLAKLEDVTISKNISSVESPKPSERTSEYYKKRPCPEMVAQAAGIVAEYLYKRCPPSR